MKDATDVSARTYVPFAFSVGSFIVDLRRNAWGDRIGVAPTTLRRMAAEKGCVEIIFHRPHPLGGPKRQEHDPEKWIPVFGKDHAPTLS
jgi:hypothetical protein